MNEIGIGSVVFGSWTIVKKIGSGSFGTVYQIKKNNDLEWEGIDAQYAALKVLYIPRGEQEVMDLSSMGMDRASVQNYYKEHAYKIFREINIMYPLKGKENIVGYEDYQILKQSSGIGYIILIRMELLTPINKYAASHPMNPERTIQLGIDLCQALEACEELKIIHRDIKPDNIFVNRFGTFKLGDFGIARTAEGTTEGTTTGTYGYMAPEVRIGKYNATVDIYSTGIVLYRYLNGGRLPFMPARGTAITPGDMETAIKMRFSGNNVPPIPGVDPALNAIVSRACAFRPADRYQTATEFKNALLNYRYERKRNYGNAGTANYGNTGKTAYANQGTTGYPNTETTGYVNSGTTTYADPGTMNYGNQGADRRRNSQTGTYYPYTTVEPENNRGSAADSPKAEWSRRDTENSQNTAWNKSVTDKPVAEVTGKKEKKDQPKKGGKAKTAGIFAAGVAVAVAAVLAGNAILPNLPFATGTKETTTAGSSTTTTDKESLQPTNIAEVGEIVTYGSYEQDGNTLNGPEKIEWIVLDVKGDEALLISNYGLDAIPYNYSSENVTWEKCSLREWLNSDFMNDSFTSEEQSGIVQTTLENDDNPDYGTQGGNKTADYIFCLSLEESEEYFEVGNERICYPTEYAVTQGTRTANSGSCWWWLRSPGSISRSAIGVNCNGVLMGSGFDITCTDRAVRPAMWVKISNLES